MKRTNLYALTLTSAAMVCGAAAAQERSNPNQPSTTARSGALDRNLSAGNVHATNVIGATVKNKAGDTIGTIDDLILSSNANITSAVMSVGGVLGVGGKKVALPYKEFTAAPDGKTLYLDKTEEQLKSMPAYDEDKSVSSRTHTDHDTAAATSSPNRATSATSTQRDAAASSARTSGSAPHVLKANEQPASALIGAEVVDRSDSKVGKIKDVIVSSGRGAQAVVTVGGSGVGNLGGKMVTVPLDDLTIKRDQDNPKHEPDKVQTTMSLAQIDSMPEFRYE
jgi:sporulation protein YlmC with PRC-barrel domain